MCRNTHKKEYTHYPEQFLFPKRLQFIVNIDQFNPMKKKEPIE